MIAGNLGYPRIGTHRELKSAIEGYWAGSLQLGELERVASGLRRLHWRIQSDAGITQIPSNDFSFYDHVLDTSVLVGAIPSRFGKYSGKVPIDAYFSMARGNKAAAAMEMTKWFDTNYHYIVPEFEPGVSVHLASDAPVRTFLEARAEGIHTRPVLLGPVSFVMLGKFQGSRNDREAIIREIAGVYVNLFEKLRAAGADWVQIDEPCLGLDLTIAERALFTRCYEQLASAQTGLRVLVATYFSDLAENLDTAIHLPVEGLHLDLVRAPQQLKNALANIPGSLLLSLGLVDGRNIWRCNLRPALELVRLAADKIGPDRIEIAPSCSLIHVPNDSSEEHGLRPGLQQWIAFARQKLEEIHFLAEAGVGWSEEIERRLHEDEKILEKRFSAPGVRNNTVWLQLAEVSPALLNRSGNVAQRRIAQAEAIPLPPLPTTTIGSFPQTAELRRVRAEFRSGRTSKMEYDRRLRAEVESCIRFQEAIGLDVLVHGEFERNDMVEYFAEQMEGFATTRNGWIQSYGTRCVKPPIIFGDVSRPAPMSVQWPAFAQSLTRMPVKAILTGPVTILQWSFVRDDLTREQVCHQLAMAIREEVQDLQAAGLRVIQVDEPALREALPLQKSARPEYLRWAVQAFRLATAVAENSTQIHTHMCYSDFDDILSAITELDADVISIEAARSQMALLKTDALDHYPAQIGPGVYDVHGARIPDVREIKEFIHKALKGFSPDQLWINPDCGLKTRRWEEVRVALFNMVEATEEVRHELADFPMEDAVNSDGCWPYHSCGCT